MLKGGSSCLWPIICLILGMLVLCCSSLRSSTDSILDIINTHEVERLLAARKHNATREERRFLAQNALEDEEISAASSFEDDDDEDRLFLIQEEATRELQERRQQQQKQQQQQQQQQQEQQQQLQRNDSRKTQLQTASSPRKGQQSTMIGIDTIIRKSNESSSQFPYKGPDLLSELGGFRGDKLLKSSKNALLVTRKEYLKRDWCKTEPLMQKVREEGCLTRTVINRFCYGQCNSFYIPKNPRRKRPRRRGDSYEDDEEDESNAPAFKSCAFCKPKKASWITVTLNCPSLSPQLRKKRILRIKQCKCITEVIN